MKNYYAVITSQVLYHKDLSCRQKLLVAMIANMSNERGYCFASNKHFAEAFDCEERTIQRDLSDLENKGILGRVMKLDAQGNLEFRSLVINSEFCHPLMTQKSSSHDTDVIPPHDMGVTIKTNNYKNKSNNNNNDVVEIVRPNYTPSLDNQHIEVDQLKPILMQRTSWRDIQQRNGKYTDEQFEVTVNAFIEWLKEKGELTKTPKDARFHYNNFAKRKRSEKTVVKAPAYRKLD
jgi:hypothetical protein